MGHAKPLRHAKQVPGLHGVRRTVVQPRERSANVEHRRHLHLELRVNSPASATRAVLASFVVAIVFPVVAASPDSLVPDLEQRLAASSVDKVNAHLVSHWTAAMTPLNRK